MISLFFSLSSWFLGECRSERGRGRPRSACRAVCKPWLQARRKVFVEQLEDRTLLSGAAGGTDRLLEAYGQIPLSFEANQGQTDAAVNFLSRGSGYTLFLTPGHYSEVLGMLGGQMVSVGIDLGVEDQKLSVTRVYPNSPASEAGLSPHDRVVRIGPHDAESVLPEKAAEWLRGEAGKAVELAIVRADSSVPRRVKLVRRSVIIPSVEYGLLEPDVGSVAVPIGRVKITNFQETTPREVVEALLDLAA